MRIDYAWPWVSLHKLAIFGLITVFLLTLLPFLFFDILRVRSATPIGYNEGCMVIHTSRLLSGQSLYKYARSGFSLTPVNYPPLSFMTIGALSYFTGSILLTGKLVSLLSFLFVAYLIYGIVFNFSSNRYAALLGALVKKHALTSVDRTFQHIPLHVSLYLYSKWIDNLRGVCGCRRPRLRICFGWFLGGESLPFFVQNG